MNRITEDGRSLACVEVGDPQFTDRESTS